MITAAVFELEKDSLMPPAKNAAVLRKTRRAARELTLNVLYQCDIGVPFDEALPTAVANANLAELVTAKYDASEEAREYAQMLTRGIRDNRDQVDAIISDLSKDWPLERQPNVDRNVLRIALYEIIYVSEVPVAVSIDEAVELANLFSTDDSGKFVNGVLAAYVRKNAVEKKTQ